MKIDLQILQSYIDAGWINVQSHPTLPLKIYKYSAETTFAKHWDDITKICRGLVLDDEGNVIINCIPKFFNNSDPLSNFEDLKSLNFISTEKWDGSLIQIGRYKEHLIVTSSGSFTSPQAQTATELIKWKEDYFKSGFSYVFELVYPENRIVISYGNMIQLTLLTIRENDTGAEFEPWTVKSPFDTLHPINISMDQMLIEQKRSDFINKEGWVVKFSNGERVKIKYDEYMRLHKIVSGINEKFIWETLKDGKIFDEIYKIIPDELFQWVESYQKELQDKFNKIEQDCLVIFGSLRTLEKKPFALEVIEKYKDVSTILFLMYNNKSWKECIWKMLQPKCEYNFGRGEG